jgi:predicted aconitase
MYKNNSRYSRKFRGCSPLQLSCNLTGKCYEVGYYSYTNRWQTLGSDSAKFEIDEI